MNNVKPVGSKLIVKPLNKEHDKTEGGLFVVNLELEEGEIVLVSDAIADLYKVGDIVLFPQKSGVAIIINNEPCVWLKGGEPDNPRDSGDIWGILMK